MEYSCFALGESVPVSETPPRHSDECCDPVRYKMFKLQYSTCRKLVFLVFVPFLCAHTEICEAFSNTQYCTKSYAQDMVIICEICYFM